MKTSVRVALRASAVVAAVAVASTLAARAQQQTPLRTPRESPKSTVMQTVGVTDVSVTYSRPGVKGRRIWGDAPTAAPAGEATLDDARSRAKDAPIVAYGRVWRAGANEATLFKVTDDVLVQGQPLAAGSYSLHMIPGRAEWTIIFNRDDGQWGSFQYDAAKDALRVKAKPETAADAQEWLTYDIEPTGPSAARVNLRWERLRVPFTVEVKDVTSLVLSKARAAMAARPDDWQVRLQAFNFANSQNVNQDEAARWLEDSIRIKETFNNLSAKARWLAAQGKRAEAAATGDRALEVGRAAKVPAQALADFEKRVAEWKAKN
ncbi:MAG TPA: DUF2911 domain-containing protein [Pyrinomonadaceae bacterium]|nr:DUF2911 domain-containing protein [Pyrinomonadaceae bacterium]